MFSSYANSEAIGMYFVYHLNIFALFFAVLFYRKSAFLVGLPLFLGYCVSIIVLFLLNHPIHSYVKIFSVLYDFGMGLIFVLCVFASAERLKRYRALDGQNLIVGFGLGFFIFILSVLVSLISLYGLSLLFNSYKAFLYFLIVESLALGLFLLYFFEKNVYVLLNLLGKVKKRTQEKFYCLVFIIGGIGLVLNFLPFVVECFKRL